MRKHRITDDEASAVLRGQAREARPDLASMADAVAMFRRASFESSPQPSAELAGRLDLERAARISNSADELYASTAVSAPVIQASVPRTRRRSVALSGFVGLGLAAKIAIGVAATAAVGVTGAGAAGAVGVLPSAAQEVFDQVTGQHPGGDNVSETGIENSEFGLKTAEEARLKGEAKREAALQKAAEKAQSGLDTAGEKAQAGLETAGEKAQAGLETAGEKAQAGLDAAGNAGDVADEHTSTGLDAASNAVNRATEAGND
jgi:hypothetical protein